MSALEDRLARQLAASGRGGSKAMARTLLVKRGDETDNGQLTAAGKKRQAMGADGRAKDRAAKASGGAHKASDYAYDAKTNAASLKK